MGDKNKRRRRSPAERLARIAAELRAVSGPMFVDGYLEHAQECQQMAQRCGEMADARADQSPSPSGTKPPTFG